MALSVAHVLSIRHGRRVHLTDKQLTDGRGGDASELAVSTRPLEGILVHPIDDNAAGELTLQYESNSGGARESHIWTPQTLRRESWIPMLLRIGESNVPYWQTNRQRCLSTHCLQTETRVSRLRHFVSFFY